MHIRLSVAQLSVRSKAGVLLLLNDCFLSLQLFVGVLYLIHDLFFSTECPSSFVIILIGVGELVALL